jgi:hypothetical protein
MDGSVDTRRRFAKRRQAPKKNVLSSIPSVDEISNAGDDLRLKMLQTIYLWGHEFPHKEFAIESRLN